MKYVYRITIDVETPVELEQREINEWCRTLRVMPATPDRVLSVSIKRKES